MERTSQSAKAALVLVLVAVVFVSVRGCPWQPKAKLPVQAKAGKPGRFETTFPTMGTDARLEVAAGGKRAARRMFNAVLPVLDEVDRLMSTYRPDSEISFLNYGGYPRAVPISEPTFTVLHRSMEISRLTGGAFDVTYAPLRALWRRAQQVGHRPLPREVRAALRTVGYGKLHLNEASARQTVPGMAVDLGGIAKGYAIDMAARALQAEGAPMGIVDIGGDLLLFGDPDPGPLWRVGLRRPPGALDDLVLNVPPSGVATSGDYERFFTVQGQNFSHIIDPRTGRPVKDAASVTVVAPDAMTADALATAFSVMGPEEGIALADSLAGVECLMLTRGPDGTVRRTMSAGFGRMLEE